MLRSFFVYLSKASWARQIVVRWPLARKMASRFVAGDKLEDAVSVIQASNAKGINASLDHLGEHTTNAQDAQRATNDILNALDAIEQNKLRANVSVKLTQIGLVLDPELCASNLRKILEYARQRGNFIRVDMEDSKVTQLTLDIFCRMLQEGFGNVGIVIQSYLYRSEQDIPDLIKDCVKVRLCKGAYKESADVAHARKKAIDAAFDRLVDLMIRGVQLQDCPLVSQDGKIPPMIAIATHDVNRILNAKAIAQKAGLPTRAIEFQMLHGIRRDLQESLAAEGYPVRIYVPYGTEWYPYFMRRLGERPANIWFIVHLLFQRG